MLGREFWHWWRLKNYLSIELLYLNWGLGSASIETSPSICHWAQPTLTRSGPGEEQEVCCTWKRGPQKHPWTKHPASRVNKMTKRMTSMGSQTTPQLTLSWMEPRMSKRHCLSHPNYFMYFLNSQGNPKSPTMHELVSSVTYYLVNAYTLF